MGIGGSPDGDTVLAVQARQKCYSSLERMTVTCLKSGVLLHGLALYIPLSQV
jgi:hypothetical protein